MPARPLTPASAARIEALIGAMTLEEKVAMCHARTTFTSAGVPRLGIPEFVMSDGPHGVREEIAPDSFAPAGRSDDTGTCLPTGTALAATWNPALARLFGDVLGGEARARGKDCILGPGLNIIRTPLCGRNFEYASEDPCLTAALAPALIRGIQDQDVAACAKHFALNNQELDRMRVDVEADERTLRELYLPAFEAAVRAGGCLTVMGAYNRFRGQHCCHHHGLLVEILKGEWGFPGAVISDWGGVHDTDEAAANGLDLEMGTGWTPDQAFLGAAFLDRLRDGRLPVALVDDKVRRILRVMFAIGLFDPARSRGRRNTPEHHAAARRIATEAMVLLKNDGMTLPLNPNAIRTLTVIGDNATRRHAAGGGSSGVKADHEVTLLDGLARRLGAAVRIRHVPGYPDLPAQSEPLPLDRMEAADAAGIRGWHARYFTNLRFAGTPAFTATETRLDYDWSVAAPFGECPPEGRSAHWTARIRPRASGVHVFILTGDDCALLRIDGATTLSIWGNAEPLTRTFESQLEADRVYTIEVLFNPKQRRGRVALNWTPPALAAATVGAGTRRDEALAAARDTDAVIFCGGLNHEQESEGADRPSLALQGGQNELIEALLRQRPDTVIVLTGGAPVEIPWLDRARAVLWTWYAGSEAGTAAAALLCGDENPSGRLPFTMPVRLADSPAHTLGEYRSGACHYREGLLVGYRYFDTVQQPVLFPFGHGLSYSTFIYSDLQVRLNPNNDAACEDETRVHVSCTLANRGTRDGAEVAQLYVRRADDGAGRPAHELKGFAKVALKAGATATVGFTLTRRDLSVYDPARRAWVLPAGPFTVEIGASSRAIALTQTVSAHA